MMLIFDGVGRGVKRLGKKAVTSASWLAARNGYEDFRVLRQTPKPRPFEQGRYATALVAAITQRDDVVAAQREVVESGGVAPPTRHVHLLGAHNMRSGAHLHAALA